MKKEIQKLLKENLKIFGYDGNCEIDGDKEDEYFYVRYIQLDDRLIDKHYDKFSKVENKMAKELKCKSILMERMDAFPNGFATYNISVNL